MKKKYLFLLAFQLGKVFLANVVRKTRVSDASRDRLDLKDFFNSIYTPKELLSPPTKDVGLAWL